MRICFFTENYYKGGLDTFLINLFNAWPQEEDELTLLCNASHPGLETIKENTKRKIALQHYSFFYTSALSQGQGKHKLARWKWLRAFYVLSHLVLQYPFLFCWYTLQLTRLFRRSNFERLMVVNGGYPASIIGISAVIAWNLAGKQQKPVFNFHNSTTPSPWYFRVQENWMDRALIRNSEKIVSVTKACLHSLFTRSAFAGCTNMQFIHNGIETPDLSQIKRVKNDANRYCLMLATYEPRKGHHYLLQAFKLVAETIPDIKLKVFGYVAKPHELEAIEVEVKRLSLEDKVELNRFTNDKEALIAGAAILVVPSQENESFGLTIIEAMALGTPVVTTDVGGMPEVLEGTGAGLVCSKSNPEAFATAMKQILNNKELATEMGQNGLKVFNERYTATKMAEQYNFLLKSTPHGANR
ncbi:MAG: glycosyltransferase family 4 protein [Bacteroidia bacterium]|jgi:glycosyltransferase involved in cell wall biosynthesis